MCRHYNFPGTETRGEEKPQKRATREEEDSRSNDDASSDRVAPRSTRVGVTVGGGKKEDDVLLSRSIRFIGVVQSIRMMSSSLFVFIRGKGETRFPAFFVFTENAPWGDRSRGVCVEFQAGLNSFHRSHRCLENLLCYLQAFWRENCRGTTLRLKVKF